jgi:hypothetical protein
MKRFLTQLFALRKVSSLRRNSAPGLVIQSHVKAGRRHREDPPSRY